MFCLTAARTVLRPPAPSQARGQRLPGTAGPVQRPRAAAMPEDGARGCGRIAPPGAAGQDPPALQIVPHPHPRSLKRTRPFQPRQEAPERLRRFTRALPGADFPQNCALALRAERRAKEEQRHLRNEVIPANTVTKGKAAGDAGVGEKSWVLQTLAFPELVQWFAVPDREHKHSCNKAPPVLSHLLMCYSFGEFFLVLR